MKGYFFIVFGFLLPSGLMAQQYNFQTYSVNNGLPHAQIHDVFQTHDGYIWLGTYGGGLAKFDGRSYKIFDTKDGLRDNAIEVVFEDSRHNLWVATNGGGVAKMKEKNFVYPFQDSALDSLSVIAIEEINSKLWIGTIEGGLFVYDYKIKELSELSQQDGLINNTVWDFWKSRDDKIWIATQGGISIYDGKKFKNITKSDGLSGDKIFRLAAQQNGDVWMATNNGITIWDGQHFTTRTQVDGVQIGYVFDLLVTSAGVTWIGTELKGVFVYENRSFTHFTVENGLSSDYIYSLYEDAQHNVWIATDQNGVNILKGRAFQFFGAESGLNSEMVFSLHRDKSGRLWAGTHEGIFYKDDERFQKFPLPEGYNSSKEIWDIAEFENGDLLFLMPDNILYKWDGSNLTNYSKKHGLKQWFTYDIYIDRNNTLWIGTADGLFHYNNGETSRYTNEDGLAGNVIQSIYEYSGNFWIGTYNGLSRFDGESFKSFTVKDGLAHNQVSQVAADEKGNIWLGTGGGVSVLKRGENRDSVQIENFGKETGMKLLKSQIIWFDGNGNLWQGTNGGIHRFDVPAYRKTGSMKATHYKLSNSGIGVETNYKAIVPLDEDGVLFGTMNGVLKIVPSEINPDSMSPHVYITGIKRDAQALKSTDNIDSLEYKLGRKTFSSANFPYGYHSYTFQFSALEFKYPDNVQYRYRLKGFDDEWTTTAATSATFTNIDAGSYTFEVQAKSRERYWPVKKAQINFAIDFPFWQTYWFYSLVAIGLIGFVYGYTQVRLQMLEKRRLKELVDEQTKDLTLALEEKEVLIKEIHHRVKNNLAVISGLLELQVDYTEDGFSAKVLRESQRRVKSISMIHEKLYQNERLSEINFAVYIDELVDIIADSNNHPDKKIEVKKVIDDVKLGVNQGIPCGLILNELLSNAFEHAFKGREEGKILIKLQKKEGGEVEFSVADNGIGLPSGFENTRSEASSLGVILVETFTQQLEGQLTINRLENGTLFLIKFDNGRGE